MASIRALCSHRLRSSLCQKTSSLPFLRSSPHESPISRRSRVISDVSSSYSILQRPFSGKIMEFTIENESTDSDGSEQVKEMEEKTKKGKKGKKSGKEAEVKRLKKVRSLKNKIRKLEREVENLKESSGVAEEKKEVKEMGISSIEGIPAVQSKPVSLSSLFTVKRKNWNSTNVANYGKIEKKEPIVLKPKPATRSVIAKPLKLKEDGAAVQKELSLENSSKTGKKEPIVSKPKREPLKLMEDGAVQKELSPEMVALVSRWHEEGYLNSATDVLPPLKLRFTAEKFGQDHQEIAKWLSGADLKRIALFGCPSVEKKSAFAAKRLRSFFSIQEDIVCRTCTLKSSCRFVNQKTWKKVEHLHLSDVMRVLTSYDLDVVPSHVEIPDEMKASISKVLKEVINLSK